MARTGIFRHGSRGLRGLFRILGPLDSSLAAGRRRKAQKAHPGGVRGYNRAKIAAHTSGKHRHQRRDAHGRFT